MPADGVAGTAGGALRGRSPERRRHFQPKPVRTLRRIARASTAAVRRERAGGATQSAPVSWPAAHRGGRLAVCKLRTQWSWLGFGNQEAAQEDAQAQAQEDA